MYVIHEIEIDPVRAMIWKVLLGEITRDSRLELNRTNMNDRFKNRVLVSLVFKSRFQKYGEISTSILFRPLFMVKINQVQLRVQRKGGISTRIY